MKKLTRLVLGAGVAAGLAAAASLPATAADFSGKTIEWTIPFSETGGSAKWANFFAPLISEHMDGNPTVVVKFMPGAGSTKGAKLVPRSVIQMALQCSAHQVQHSSHTYWVTHVFAMNIRTGFLSWPQAQAALHI